MARRTNTTMKKLILIGLSALLLTGCFYGNEANSNHKLTKDFWLNWWGDSTDQNILLSEDSDGHSGIGVIEQTVFAVGYNDNFIIAKQHPDKEEEVSKRLFGDQNSKGDIEITNLADTVFLSKADRIYQDNGKWYHVSNLWNPPDSLKPYKKITYFHIVDIRNYKRKNWDSYKVYTFDKEAEFINKRHQLGVPDELKFTINSPTLE